MSALKTTVIELGETHQTGKKRVLNTGCGPYAPERLHPAFRGPGWTEVRLDLNPEAKPDIVASIADLGALTEGSFDAIWCSHNLEHLHTHQIPAAISGFRRILKPDGFALIATPDLEAIAELVVDGKLEVVAYKSPAGPISALDMLYGLSTAIARGNHFMSHHTGFSADRLGRLLVEAGFAEVVVKNGEWYSLWALALMPEANKDGLLHHFRANELDLFSEQQ